MGKNKKVSIRYKIMLILVVLIITCLTIFFIYTIIGKNYLDIPNESAYENFTTQKKNIIHPRKFHCHDKPLETYIEEKGNYLAYYNIIRATREFKCDESVTITTMADYTFLDNIIPLVEKWKGPISVALYSPGDDFQQTLISIYYLRFCSGDLVKELVTFHLYHERNHIPQFPNGIVSHIESQSNIVVNCTIPPPYISTNKNNTYRYINNLKFPINLGRNIARRGVQTHYFLSSDIELYPSDGLINHFLNMIQFSPELQVKRIAFALPLFEVNDTITPPSNKTDLQILFAENEAVNFHEHYCKLCHNVPKLDQWKESKAPISGEITEFARSKRQGDFYQWEPCFIGTQADPFHDEHLYWEGAGDKMVQAYAMCLLDYDFVVLENAFLIHKPGIKKSPPQSDNERNISREKMEKLIKPELNALFGYRMSCVMLK